jgi:HEAT repeat protein
LRLKSKAVPALLLCLAVLFPHAVRAQAPPAAPGGDVPERLSRIEQAMWNRETQAVPLLREWAVRDPSERVRERSLGALNLLEDKEAAGIFLGRLSGDNSARVRRAAAEAIGSLALPVPAPRLTVPLERDPDAMVRAECARAIGLTGLSAGGPALIVSLVKDPSPEVRALSAQAISRLALPDSAALLQGVAQNDPSGLVQIYAIRALSEENAQASARLFRDIMAQSLDADVRVEALRGLIRGNSPNDWIAAGLEDPDERIRFLSFQHWLQRMPARSKDASGLDRRSDVVLRLESLLADPVPGIRDLARATLEKLGFRVRSSGFKYTIEN